MTPLPAPEMVGISDAEALMPRTRPTFEGYRLLREYFMMPERFHYVRVCGLQPVVRRCEAGLEIIFLFRRPVPELADLTPADFELFATPIINLFERECNVIELDRRRTRQVLHADRTRPRDFEIYRVTPRRGRRHRRNGRRYTCALRPWTEPGQRLGVFDRTPPPPRRPRMNGAKA